MRGCRRPCPARAEGVAAADSHERRLPGMTVWFTADTHFGHAGALGRFRRPFASVQDMDEAMIRRWNETVGPEDDVWHLGDFALRYAAERMAAILDRLA